MDRGVVEDLRRALEVLKEKTQQSGDEQIRTALDAAQNELEKLEERVCQSMASQLEEMERVRRIKEELWTRRERGLLSRVCALSAALKRKQQEKEERAERVLEHRTREQAQLEQCRKSAENQRRGKRAWRGVRLRIMRRSLDALEVQSEENSAELQHHAAVMKHFHWYEDQNRQLRIQLLKKEEELEKQRRRLSGEREKLQRTVERSEELRLGCTTHISRVLEGVKKSAALRSESSQKENRERRSFWRRWLCC